MSMLDAVSFLKWSERFHELPINYKAYGLNNFFKLSSYAVHPGFMAHMQSRWNSDTRTFHIGQYQICPTLEEFRAILMIKPAPMLSLKPHTNSISFKTVLQKEFGLTRTAAEAIFKGHVMDLQRWHNTVLRDGEIPRDDFTIPMLVTMFLAHRLLAPSGGKPSVKVFEVAYTLQQSQRDISGLVLAETLMGLNEGSYTLPATMRGCPVALYIWLMDKVKRLPPVHRYEVATLTVQQTRREEARPNDAISDEVCPRHIMPWYDIRSMKYSMDGRPIVILLGLERATSYTTTSLFLQFGRDRMPYTSSPSIHIDAPITFKMYDAYANKLDNALSLDIPRKYVDPMDEYIKDPLSYKRKPGTQPNEIRSKQTRKEGATTQSHGT